MAQGTCSIDLDKLVRLLCRWDEAQEVEDAEAVLAQLHDYLTIDRLWDLVGKVRAGETLAEGMRQYEDHLLGVEAALDVYRKATTGTSEGVAREYAIYGGGPQPRRDDTGNQEGSP